MYLNITGVNLELTDRCQAACPMCARNDCGGKDMPHINNVDMTLEKAKQWFTPEWIYSIREFNASGNNGDPAIAKECLEIFEYLISHSHPDCRFRIYTNGSLRTKKWWQDLAKLFGNRGDVVFAIDGFAEQHSLYRRNTNFHTIINNAKTFIEAGGQALANTIVFKHNEHVIDDLKFYLVSLGFKQVDFIYTPRFLGANSYPVKNNNGEILYTIQPPTSTKDIKQKQIPIFKKEEIFNLIQECDIVPKCSKDLYIDPLGNVYPCSSLHRWCNEVLSKVETFEEGYKDISINDAKNMMAELGHINLNGTDIKSALDQSNWNAINTFWKPGKKNTVCAATCSTMGDVFK
jgi:MoaA/NifB/PqqE/SkfB family radical SAM enzyme